MGTVYLRIRELGGHSLLPDLHGFGGQLSAVDSLTLVFFLLGRRGYRLEGAAGDHERSFGESMYLVAKTGRLLPLIF